VPELFFFGLPRNLYLVPDNLLSGEMMKKFLILVLLSMLVFPFGVSALVTYSGDSVIINDPVNDDIFATGSTIEVNAPVHSIVAAGGTITINAPVRGDVVAAGGTVTINNDVGGKVVAVGGSVDLAGNVSTNAVIQGGTVNIRKSATIGKDASISAGSVRNAGTVTGTLSVQSPSVENTGSAGTFDLRSDHSRGKLSLWFIPLVAFLLIIGWFIIGILLIRIMPVRFLQVESEVRTSTIVRCVAGFAGIIIAFVAFVLLAITIVLFPLAIILGLLVLVGLLIANLFVASSLGRIIFRYLKWSGTEWQLFTVGFVVLLILYLLPVINILAFVISVSLGFGAILYAVRNNWGAITGSPPS
jgi:hypothetical protein